EQPRFELAVSRLARTKIGYGKIVFRYFDARIVDRDHDGRERLRADLVRVRRGTAIWIARDRGVEYDGLVDHHGELHRGKLTGAHLELARRERGRRLPRAQDRATREHSATDEGDHRERNEDAPHAHGTPAPASCSATPRGLAKAASSGSCART